MQKTDDRSLVFDPGTRNYAQIKRTGGKGGYNSRYFVCSIVKHFPFVGYCHRCWYICDETCCRFDPWVERWCSGKTLVLQF